MTEKKYVILRESFPNGNDDEESLFAVPGSFAKAQDDRGPE